MKQKYSLILDDDFIRYCKLNGIEDVEKEAKETFKRGFDLLKYGTTPVISFKIDKFLEKPPITPYIPLIITPPLSEPRKEESSGARSKNKDIVIAESQTIVKPPKKDLYDEG